MLDEVGGEVTESNGGKQGHRVETQGGRDRGSRETEETRKKEGRIERRESRKKKDGMLERCKMIENWGEATRGWRRRGDNSQEGKTSREKENKEGGRGRRKERLLRGTIVKSWKLEREERMRWRS